MANRPAPDSFILDSSDCKRHRSDPPESSSSGTCTNNATSTSDLRPKEIYSRARRVYNAAVTGYPDEIFTALSGLPPQLIANILNGTYHNMGRTPLLCAVELGNLSVVQFLLKNFDIDVEQRFQIHGFGNCIYTVLYLAAMVGHLDVVTHLVQCGADVNRGTWYAQTALHIACYEGHVDVVRYLVERGARTDILDGKGLTCLMATCLRDRTEVVELLLEKFVDYDQKSDTHQTAMHIAVDCNAVGSAKLLLEHGATMIKNKHGRTPLVEAILSGSRDLMNIILRSSAVSRQERVDALELWGAVCISLDIFGEGFVHLNEAMKQRFKNPPQFLLKFQFYPVPVLDGVSESLTLAELQSRRDNQIKLMKESVLIFDRILGPGYVNRVNTYWPICDRFMERKCYREALAVWTHAWKRLEGHCHLHVVKLFEFLNQMWETGSPPAFEAIARILDMVLTDLEKFRIQKDGNNFFWVRGFYICLLSCALNVKIGADDKRQLKDFAKLLVQNSVGYSYYPLLHQVIGTLVSCSDEVSQRNSWRVVEILLVNDATVNDVDWNGNTPLHFVALLMHHYENEVQSSTRKDLLCSSTRVLMEKGAHACSRNNVDETPLDLASPSVWDILHEYFPLSLKCIAASAIVSHNIPYKDVVPMKVQDFIKLHHLKQNTS